MQSELRLCLLHSIYISLLQEVCSLVVREEVFYECSKLFLTLHTKHFEKSLC